MSWVLWMIAGMFAIVAMLMLLGALRVGSQWDAALERVFRMERNQRCRACIAANPDKDCSECGWSEVE